MVQLHFRRSGYNVFEMDDYTLRQLISGELYDISQFKNKKTAGNSLMCFNTVITNCTKNITNHIHKSCRKYLAMYIYSDNFDMKT